MVGWTGLSRHQTRARPGVAATRNVVQLQTWLPALSRLEGKRERQREREGCVFKTLGGWLPPSFPQRADTEFRKSLSPSAR